MRERGSSTARPTEKGGGGSPDSVAIRSIRSISARRFGRFRRVDSVDSVDFGASIRSISACRFVPIGSRRDSVARPVDFGASRRDLACFLSISARRFGRFRSVSVAIRRVASRFGVLPVDFGASRRDSVDSVDSVASIRSVSVASRRDLACRVNSDHRGRCRSQGANTKKARFLNGGIGPRLSQGVARS